MKVNYFKLIDNFLHFVSKLVIIIPLLILSASFFLKFNSKEETNYKKIFPSITITPTKIASISAVFDISGPLVCEGKNLDNSFTVYIKDKKIFATKKEKSEFNYFLLKDDCLYLWKEGTYSGEKICNISPYFSYFNQLLKLLDAQVNNLNMFPINDSCRKEEIKDEKIFEVPAEILFKKTELNF